MKVSLHRRAKQSPRFGRSFAEFDLLLCTSHALAVYFGHLQNQTQPKAVRKADLLAAAKALRTLEQLAERGLHLHNAVKPLIPSPGPDSLWPINWASQMGKAVNSAIVNHKKPQPDETEIERHAARLFTTMLLGMFGDAPKTMIEQFGELIEYRSERLRKHADEWIAAYRTGSVV